MYQALQGATFHVEHIVPSSRGGTSDPDNLAWSCPGCNLRKSDRTEAVDPTSGMVVALFHPRRDRWSDHFRWEGHRFHRWACRRPDQALAKAWVGGKIRTPDSVPDALRPA